VVADLNPHARIKTSIFGAVDIRDVCNTKLFSLSKAQAHERWFKEEWGQSTPETEEYGISSVVLREHRPFHPERLQELLGELTNSASALSCLLRSKGFVWIASRNNVYVTWHQVGSTTELTEGQSWWIDIPRSDWPTGDEFTQEVLAHWCEPYGDRCQTLVLIGLRMNKTIVLDAFRYEHSDARGDGITAWCVAETVY
jgi:G3E family GTPase